MSTPFTAADDNEKMDLSPTEQEHAKQSYEARQAEIDDLITANQETIRPIDHLLLNRAAAYDATLDRLERKMIEMETAYAASLASNVAEAMDKILDKPLNVKKVRNMNRRINILEQNVCEIRKRLTAIEVSILMGKGKGIAQGQSQSEGSSSFQISKKRKSAFGEATSVDAEEAARKREEMRRVEEMFAGVVKRVDEFKISRGDVEDADEVGGGGGGGGKGENMAVDGEEKKGEEAETIAAS